ncbi:MAG: HEAT repeat domain-containing protein [Acidobacteriota bacterium]
MRQRGKTLLIITALLFMIISAHVSSEAKNPEKGFKDWHDILAEFPADGTEDMEILTAELIKLGKNRLAQFCLFLESPKDKVRIKTQYALHGLAVQSARLSTEKERFLVSKAFIKSLKSMKNTQAKKFIISQLQLVGKREAVKPLSQYLSHQKLCEPAARALLSLETEGAEKAFLKSLDSVSGERRITVVKALGELQSKKAVEKIKPFVSSEDKELRRVSLYSLANIGDPSCLGLLGRMRIRSSVYERSRAPLIYLLYIRRLAESGYKELSLNICRDLIKNYTAEEESQVQCGALDLLVRISGEEAIDDLLGIMESSNKDLRQKALASAVDIYIGEMGERWIQKIEQGPPGVKAEILSMLGRTGDESLLDFFRRKLKSEHQVVRMAVVMPLSRWGKERVIDDLFGLLYGNRKEETELVKQALFGYQAEFLIPRIQKEFYKMPLNARIALIQVISNKQAFSCADLVLSQAQSPDEDLRSTALSNLERVVDENDVSSLITLLKEAETQREIRWLQQALQAACQFIPEPEKRAEKVLEALAESEDDKKPVFLRPLSGIGGEKALEAVLEYKESEDLETSSEAFYALVQWKAIEAADELLILGKMAEEKKQRYLSLKSYIGLVTSSEMDDENKLEMLRDARTIPEETDEEKLILSGLEKIKTIDSLELAAEFLYHEELKESAARIIAHIALPEPLKEGLSGERVVFLLKEALKFIEDEFEREQILEYINQIGN